MSKERDKTRVESEATLAKQAADFVIAAPEREVRGDRLGPATFEKRARRADSGKEPDASTPSRRHNYAKPGAAAAVEDKLKPSAHVVAGKSAAAAVAGAAQQSVPAEEAAGDAAAAAGAPPLPVKAHGSGKWR